MSQEFNNIPSQFDNIVEGHPVVFISYSWDSDDHKKWVRKLADNLVGKFGINVLLDQYNRGGYSLIDFMKKGIERANRVLIIGTSNYKQKSEKNSGGANFEDQIISSELLNKMDSHKFIPVLREGSFSTSFSSIIETRAGFDMSDETYFEDALFRLSRDIWNNPENQPPALGPIPNFVNSKVNSPIKKELSFSDFVQDIKRLLQSPYSEIALTEMIESEGKAAYKIIIDKADYNQRLTKDVFNYYKKLHIEAVEKLIGASIIVVRYGTLKQQELFVKELVRLCKKPFKEGEISYENMTYLHLFAPSFLFHSLGMACLLFNKFALLPELFKEKSPQENALSCSISFGIAYLLGITHWHRNELNQYLEIPNGYFPYSTFIMDELESYFKEYLTFDNDYPYLYYSWEHLLSISLNYYGCLIGEREWFPMGAFLWGRKTLLRKEENFYTKFINKAFEEKDNWQPLKDGLFDNKYSEFLNIYNMAEQYYKSSPAFL